MVLGLWYTVYNFRSLPFLQVLPQLLFLRATLHFLHSRAFHYMVLYTYISAHFTYSYPLFYCFLNYLRYFPFSDLQMFKSHLCPISEMYISWTKQSVGGKWGRKLPSRLGFGIWNSENKKENEAKLGMVLVFEYWVIYYPNYGQFNWSLLQIFKKKISHTTINVLMTCVT